MKNVIYLRRNRKVVVQPGRHVLPDNYMATALKNIEYLGFTFSRPLMEALRTLSIEEFTAIYHQLVADLKSLLGANVNFKPMYHNFPEQVMLLSQAELYLNAIYHYITLELPEHEAIERLPLLDQVDLKIIDLGSQEDFDQTIRNLIAAKGSISEQDKEDIEWVIAAYDDLGAVLPDEIPLKENVGFVVGTLLKYDKASLDLVGQYVKTATDVLRLAVAFSDGDVSLAANTKFRKFKRAERRLLLGLLDRCGNIVEDMLRYKRRWIRLGEILHPAEYKNRYAHCQEAFDILRNNKPYETFNGKVELALRRKDTLLAAALLKTRAGELARRLDHLLRLSGDTSQEMDRLAKLALHRKDAPLAAALLKTYAGELARPLDHQVLRLSEDALQVMERFAEVADQVSTPVLLQVMAHFSHRQDMRELRTFFPKGNVAKAMAIPNTLPGIHPDACAAVVDICRRTLTRRFSELPPLGAVYIDESLKQYLMPFSQRSASKALRTIVRGSRVKMPEGDTIRFFLWWKEGMVNGKHTGRVDIDLSAVMYNKNWKYVEHISYTNLRSDKYKAAHSGDITSAPQGACEFIDLHIPSIVRYGGRYIVASLNSFTEQPYCDLPECYAGWMMRQAPKTGEVFEPSTVADKIDLTADTRIAIPVILDLVERTVIWTDLALKQHPYYYNNVEGNKKGMVLMGKAMTTLTKPTLYDLFTLHATARGRKVEHADEADTVFAVDRGVTPYDISTIMSEYIV
ncbi:TerD family protein [Paenibacillus sp. MZ04-78.2]|uniref:TerD family protein n=1 Tax=Paenibacillus sp. MZ04-78.2 TaxID=2962034 RepID=UPI0020B8C776|nr:TerD family protein [Paenibacillus sp. MZ04-78.2]MCP3776496.1 TerD family protein [Paenibacillus sp. MZ04-78.2]